MRLEVTTHTVDVWVTRAGLFNAAVSAAACLALLALGGVKTSAAIVASVVALTSPIAWFGHRRRTRPGARPPRVLWGTARGN